MTEFRVSDVDLQEFLHSFTDGDGKLPSDFEQLKREGHYLIHGDTERSFCLKEREIYLKDTMENLLARSICFFSNMPISYAVHVKASGRADITVLDNKRLSMEIKEKQVKGKSITVRYKDGTSDKGALETEKYIKGPFGEKVSAVHYACVADSLLYLSREIYTLSYAAENERSLSAAVREIRRKREHSLPERAKGFFRSWLEDIKLLPAIRQGSFCHGMPDEDHIVKLKKLMKAEGYIRITPEQAAQAKKFNLPRYFLQNNGMVNYAHDVLSDLWDKKGALLLMKKEWAKMLDILVNEKPVRCPREILVAMKMEAKHEASIAKKEKDKETFAAIADKLGCFLEITDRHNLSHLFTGQGKDWVLPDFISEAEKEKLAVMYRLPERENAIVADWGARYLDTAGR
ncbi:MAG: hypothetical protein HDR24_06455 [Lachnospiraceae bacterium]|nr:hypothetical protein [Lachnospiraceae bacterium]